MSVRRFLVLLASQAALLCGCATSKLWEEGQFARYHEPAIPSNVRLFEASAQADVLVQYDEWREGDEAHQRRAYWLNQNAVRLQNRRKPRFVSTEQTATLTPVAVNPPSTSGSERYAIISTNGQSFTLYSGGKQIGKHELPVYADASGRIKQVALTPLTVVADLTIVGGYLCLWVWAGGGLNTVH